MLAFGPFRLHPEARRLEQDGQPVPLGSRALDLLILLVGRAGEIVSGRELLATIWRGLHVEDSALRFQIKLLRKVLGDSGSPARYIANVSGRGYSFVAPVERLPAAGAVPTNLPARTAPIIGRAGNIGIVSHALLQRRLVTIAGPGGIGKTTLAIATAEALRAGFDDAVFFVDLAPVADPALVASALAAVLGVALRAEDSIAAILESLRARRLLLVLDNCEQVVEAAAALAGRILQSLPDAHVLATSREPLQIQGERVHRLMPLDCPPATLGITALQAMAYPAMQLFLDRAGPFVLQDGDATDAVEICRQLDGIPLALELAAARVESLGVAALARRLNDMFALLTQGRRLAVPRHRTLRAVLDWSYDLLSPFEQGLLRRLAVFRTVFTLDSALAIAADLLRGAAIDALAGLIAKSLLVQYRLLEATRLYALEKLTENGDLAETARRHAEHQLALVAAAPADWESEASRRWRRRHAGRVDDIRAALDWSLSDRGDLSVGLELITVSAQYWFQLSLNLEYRRRIEQALQRLATLADPPPIIELRLHLALGHAL
ncbi:MAG: winged helix-turn-helix domain-containing protein [Aliidongia sp.]